MTTHEHAGAPLPTVEQLLQLPELQAGSPEVIAGLAPQARQQGSDAGQSSDASQSGETVSHRVGIDREVRWAHVVAGTESATLLDGGELVLTTGAGWPDDPAALRRLAEELTTAGGVGVAAIVLELSTALSEAPRELIEACDARAIPLIVLHQQVRFVHITQRVHQLVLGAQTEALEARAEVHAMLTDLGLNRSPVDYVVERLAVTLDAPVVLEDSAHRVVALAAHGHDQADVLTSWNTGGAPQLPDRSVRVAVEARGTRWGHLTALPGREHPAGRLTVLELGAFALALGRLADTDGEQWLQLASKRVFEALLSGRYRNDTELGAQLTAAGLPLAGRVILVATLRGEGDFGAHSSLERATLETALRRAVAPEGRVLLAENHGSPRTGGTASSTGAALTDSADSKSPDMSLALISLPPGDERLGQSVDGRIPALATRLARELDMLVPDSTDASWRAHLALGTPGSRGERLRELVASLEQLRSTGRISASAEVGRVAVQQAARQPLAHLVRALSSTPELQAFTSEMLGPLIEHDRQTGPGHSGDLLRVLGAYTDHPTNRSLAAQRAQLSRSVFYQRLELIESLLGVDLTDGRVIATLSVALLAHRA